MKMLKSMYTTLPLVAVWVLVLSGCQKDPFDDVVSHERSLETITLGGDLVQVGPATIDRAAGKAQVRVLMEEGTDLSDVALNIMASYKSTLSPASGTSIDFKANNNQYTYTVTSESGEVRSWVVELVPFTEEVLGTYDVQGLVVYGGTGPEYGGGAVMNLTDKPWVWPATGGPEAELDNVLTFAFGGVTADGKTFGTVTNAAGDDGAYANFLFANPATDVNHFYRAIPEGVGTWQHDYTNNTISFVFADGHTVTGKLIGAGTIDVGYDKSKTVTDEAFEFTLNGVDDWDNIYSDYDKFVKKPRRFWIDVKRR
jgi:hypothetical protein